VAPTSALVAPTSALLPARARALAHERPSSRAPIFIDLLQLVPSADCSDFIFTPLPNPLSSTLSGLHYQKTYFSRALVSARERLCAHERPCFWQCLCAHERPCFWQCPATLCRVSGSMAYCSPNRVWPPVVARLVLSQVYIMKLISVSLHQATGHNKATARSTASLPCVRAPPPAQHHNNTHINCLLPALLAGSWAYHSAAPPGHEAPFVSPMGLYFHQVFVWWAAEFGF